MLKSRFRRLLCAQTFQLSSNGVSFNTPCAYVNPISPDAVAPTNLEMSADARNSNPTRSGIPALSSNDTKSCWACEQRACHAKQACKKHNGPESVRRRACVRASVRVCVRAACDQGWVQWNHQSRTVKWLNQRQFNADIAEQTCAPNR